MMGIFDKAKDMAENVKDKVEDAAGDLKDRAEDVVDKVRNEDDDAGPGEQPTPPAGAAQ